MIFKNLKENANKIGMIKVREIKRVAIEILEKLECTLSKNKHLAVRVKIDSCVVLILRILTKDYKKKDLEGNFPSRLVVLEQSLNSSFLKLRYMVIKELLEINRI